MRKMSKCFVASEKILIFAKKEIFKAHILWLRIIEKRKMKVD